jgi:RNA polymerase sigma factor (sigma-70 family)
VNEAREERVQQSATRGGGDEVREFVLSTVREHAATLLAVARRYSLCTDDAYDAYQRTLEIFLRRAGDLERETALAWLRKVVKHEALAVRATRQASVSRAEVDVDQHEASSLPDDDEQIARFERLGRAAEALQRLKPQEITALVLKAEGHSYREICEQTGWTYTKVNRCITEGRRSFLDRYARIEAGAECERFAPLISAMADGEASARDVVELRPHLRACPACRASLREQRGAAGDVAALAPVAAVLVAPGSSGARPGGLLVRVWEALGGGLHERAAVSATKVQAAIEATSSGKLAAVAASTAALAGGGIVVEQQVSHPHAPRRAAHRQARVRPHPRRAREAAPLEGAPSVVSAPVATTPPSAPAPTPPPRPAATSPAPAQTTPAPQEFAPEQSASAPTGSRGAASASRAPSRPAPRAAPASGGEFGP